MMSDEMVEQAAVAVASEIASQIDAVLAECGTTERRAAELLEAARGLDAEAAALGNAEAVLARVERLRAQLAQLSDLRTVTAQRRVISRAAERLRESAGADLQGSLCPSGGGHVGIRSPK